MGPRVARIVADLGVLLGFAALSVGLTWPLSVHLATHIPGAGAFDNVAFLWSFWWVREVIASPADHALFSTDMLFAPFGTSLAVHTHAFLGAILGATALQSFSIVQAQNVVIIASLTFNGYCTYLLALHVSRDRLSSLVAGIYFASSPYVIGHLTGHFNLIAAWVLPLFALAWYRALENRSFAAAIAAGVTIGLTAWSDYYYVAYEVVLVGVSLAHRWVSWSWHKSPRRHTSVVDYVLAGLLAALIATVVVIKVTGGGVFFVSGVRISATTGLPVMAVAWLVLLTLLRRHTRLFAHVRAKANIRPLIDLRVAAFASGTSMIVASPVWLAIWRLWRDGGYVAPERHFRSGAEGIDMLGPIAGNAFGVIWPDVIRAIYAAARIHAVENIAWFGFAGLVALFLYWREREEYTQAGPWGLVGAVFFVWALGPYLRVVGQNSGLVLPAAGLLYVPGFANVRVPGRAMVVVYLSLAVLISVVLARWRLRKKSYVWPVIATFVIMLDFSGGPLPLHRLEVPPVYATLAGLPDGTVLELPMGIRDGFGERGSLDHETIYFQSVHHKPIVGGFVARMSRPLRDSYVDSPLWSVLLTLSEGTDVGSLELETSASDAAHLLRTADIKYVVLSDRASPVLRKWLERLPLVPVARDPTRTLFELASADPRQ